jgi:hypothetical protein
MEKQNNPCWDLDEALAWKWSHTVMAMAISYNWLFLWDYAFQF